MRRLSGPLLASLLALAAVAAIVVVCTPPLLVALFGAGADDEDPQTVLASLMDQHKTDFDAYQKRTRGRSPFYDPPQPRPTPKPPPPPPPGEDDGEPEDDPLPEPEPSDPVPTRYDGPTPIGFVGDTVFFQPARADATDLWIRVGDEPKEGITVLEIKPPWTVKLGYKKGEFDVKIFDYASIDLLGQAPRPPASPVPGIREIPPGEKPSAGSQGEGPGEDGTELAGGPTSRPVTAEPAPAGDDAGDGEEKDDEAVGKAGDGAGAGDGDADGEDAADAPAVTKAGGGESAEAGAEKETEDEETGKPEDPEKTGSGSTRLSEAGSGVDGTDALPARAGGSAMAGDGEK